MLFNNRFVCGFLVVCFMVVFTGIADSQTVKVGDFKAGEGTTGIITSVPRTMTYQGILKDSEGNPVGDGNYNITFRIYDAPTDGDLLWMESVTVLTTGGIFTIELGNTVPLNLPFDADYYLSLQVLGDSEMPDRQRMTMSAYSARTDTSDYAIDAAYSLASGDADLLDGYDSGDFALVDHNHDDDYVNENQPNSITSDMIVDETIQFGDIGQNAATVNQVMKWNGTVWVASDDSVGDGSKWSVTDSVLYTNNLWGLARGGAGNALYGDSIHGVVNFGVSCTTGTPGYVWSYSTISGGSGNKAPSAYGTVSGGQSNIAGGYGAVGGGQFNTASGGQSAIAGGRFNTTSGGYSVIAGGDDNNATVNYASICGGFRNLATDLSAFVGGGSYNRARGQYSVVSGGGGGSTADSNSALGDWSTIGGGRGNTAGGNYSIVAGGQYNTASALGSAVSGGYLNKTSGGHSVIGGGNFNVNEGNYSAIPGGYADTITTSAYMSYLFGVGSKLTQDSTFMVDMPHIRFGDETTGYEFPASDGENGNVMATDGSGQLSWVDVSGGAGGWSDDGTVVRLETSNDSVGIGTTTPAEKLDVSGNIKASGTITSGNSITIDGVNNEITSTIGTIDFDDENIVTTGKATIGPNNTNTGVDAFVVGSNNTVSGAQSTVGGGKYCKAHGLYSVVSGGGGSTAADSNSATGHYSTIGGGKENITSAYYTTVSGGIGNTASANNGAVGGGGYNDATSYSATVSGGNYNTASMDYSTVGGGRSNSAAGRSSTVAGGEQSHANGDYATVSGGYRNSAFGYYALVGGGANNFAHGQYSVICGGGGSSAADSNSASGILSFIGGGTKNSATNTATTICGGAYNSASGFESTVGGGFVDTAKGDYGGVFSGWYNLAGDEALDTAAFVGGGYSNSATADYATVGGGLENTASGYRSIVGGGWLNTASGQNSAVSGGNQNSASGLRSFVGSGYQNSAGGTHSVVCGGRNNAATGSDAIVCGGYQNYAQGSHTVILGGNQNNIYSGTQYSMVFGNFVNVANSFRVVLFDGSSSGRFGLNRDWGDGGVSYPIHVGTSTSNGNGAYLTNGGIWTSTSSRTFKENFQPLGGNELLSGISNLSVGSWQFKDSDERHIGPYAEDFVAAFDVGTIRETDGQRDNHYLAASDVAGVALAGVKELVNVIEELKQQNKELQHRIAELERRIK